MDERILASLPEIQCSFARQAIPILASDPRILAIAGAGSWAVGGMDEFSDLDFVIVVDARDKDIVVRDAQKIAASLGDLLVGFTGDHVGVPNLLICLYGPSTLHVDLKFVTLDEMHDRIEDPVILFDPAGALEKLVRSTTPRSLLPDLQWIEDRFWVWVHYACTKLERGELFECLDFLSFLRTRVLCPLATLRHGHTPSGNRRVEQRAPHEVPALAQTVPEYGSQHCIEALKAAIEYYRKLRELDSREGVLVRHERAEAAVMRYFGAAAKRLAA